MDGVVAEKRTGIPGLDEVLIDGMPLNRITLMKGAPGSGKTIFALQFLAEGVRQGGVGIFITMTETEREIKAFSASHELKLDGVSIVSMLPEGYLKGDSQGFFRTSEIELASLSKRILDEVKRLRPSRLVIDSLSELRLNMADEARFRRQITAIKHVLTGLGVTTLMLEPSGTSEVDLHLETGGLKRGSTTLLTGATGTGKSSLVTQYAIAAAARGEYSYFYLFDEDVETYVMRAEGLGLPIRGALRDGFIRVEELNPAELSPGEFACKVRAVVEKEDCHAVVIDSLSGYLNALPEERSLMLQMHELGAYLKQRNVSTFMILAQRGLLGANVQSDVDLSYLSDAVILFRAFEANGSLRVALSVVKKRYGVRERTIRELLLEPGHIRVGPVLQNFQGVLTGEPRFTGRPGAESPLLEESQNDAGKR